MTNLMQPKQLVEVRWRNLVDMLRHAQLKVKPSPEVTDNGHRLDDICFDRHDESIFAELHLPENPLLIEYST
jgi:hypothetical protein